MLRVECTRWHGLTYETADDDLALARNRDGRGNRCCASGSLGSSGLLGDTASWGGGGGGRLDGSSTARGATATGAGGLGVLHDLVEGLVEFSLSRHGGGVCLLMNRVACG
jgi:hypothetical protein